MHDASRSASQAYQQCVRVFDELDSMFRWNASDRFYTFLRFYETCISEGEAGIIILVLMFISGSYE